MSLEVRKLSLDNFADYESLTSCQSEGGCYCSFWHQKWSSMADWEKCQRETPEINRSIILEKVKSHFHVGVLVYENENLVAWVSVGPIVDFYWTWRRVGALGDAAKSTAGIVCFTIAKNYRNKGRQKEILEALKAYGKTQGWASIEGYPFDASAIEKHKDKVIWPGITKGFAEAGFQRISPHWLSQSEAERSIYEFKL
jgi:hypothetical protein